MENIESKIIKYEISGITHEGYCAYPIKKTKLPAVMIVHAWSGRDKEVCNIADKISKLGYVGFAVDLYGEAKIGKTVEENQKLMNPLIQNRELLKEKLKVSLEVLATLSKVDPTKVVAIGYCFGGLCVIDMARYNFQVKGVVSFHGLLPELEENKNKENEKIEPKVLILHGDNDPMVSREEVEKFKKEMAKRNADWQIHIFGNTKHAFTNPRANDEKLGTVYNELSSNRAWEIMKIFLKEILCK
ncbi:dienelactone hydrolase family protein [Candidatus Bandiella numerosa]|uniref:dienelactone hydrolase family protein n=1 Tax=Candidatus Bandiella numerosa TaxID=2570586 RepID=UPI00249EA840|nr:dienelactone hydrolase family protein [Candidatus Bandiella numerosa]WHA04592.1 dienelactone hydrolase family protein [Candidatus Bandiella numerosa]